MVIVAKRGAQKQTFTEKQWKEMPPDKYGWIPVTDEPEEVTAMKQQLEDKATEQKVPKKTNGKAKP